MSATSEDLNRIARERLARIDERRYVAAQVRLGDADGKIAQSMSMSESRVGRILAATELLGTEVTPEELILRAWHEGSDRGELVAQLSANTYTHGEYAPYPAEGKTAGTWDQVHRARLIGFLTEAEYEAVKAATGPAEDTP